MSTSNQEQAALAFRQATDLHQQGRLEEALAVYQSALSLEPHSLPVLNLMGVIALQRNDPASAVELFGRALQVDPQNAVVHVNCGSAHSMRDEHEAAIACYDRAIAIDPDSNASPFYNRALSLQRLKRYEAAVASYEQAIALESDLDANAYYGRATARLELRHYAAAIESFDRAIALGSTFGIEAYYSRGIAWLELKQWDAARASFDSAIECKPDYAQAHSARGRALCALGQWAAALESFDRAITHQPDDAVAHFHRAAAKCELKLWDTALLDCERALALKPDYSEAFLSHSAILSELKQWDSSLRSADRVLAARPDSVEAFVYRGIALSKLGQREMALRSFDRAIALRPDCAEAILNRGIVLMDLHQWAAALQSYDRALALRPNYAEAWSNRGVVLKELGAWQTALDSYDRAIVSRPDFAEAFSNRGNLHTELQEWEQALASYERALAIDPEVDFLRALIQHAKMQVCNWDGIETGLADLTARIERGCAFSPFAILGMTDSAGLMQRAARNWVQEMYPENFSLPVIPRSLRHERIRVGYFSPDFRNHPVSYLTAALFEAHDRTKFDVSAFSFGPNTQDAMRKRLEFAFERFIDVRDHSDQDIVRLARTMELDIAVDLAGFTQNSRPGVLALRAAPLQVSYVGYLGTMAAPYIDYLVADTTLVPGVHRQYYDEKIIYLPCYQANDPQRRIADRGFSREELALPKNGFVFCCLNTSYKITPGTFDSWMRIVTRVPGSVLFLLGSNHLTESNLRMEAVRRGVDPARLIFGRNLPAPDNLARYRIADLFLDTLPYNAGTTASDALWAGLPVLTCLGQTFAGRVAASLLNGLGLQELITATPDQYEDIAVRLATDEQRLAVIRQRLARNRLTFPLFDIGKFTRHLETGFAWIYERHLSGRAPEDVHIGSSP